METSTTSPLQTSPREVPAGDPLDALLKQIAGGWFILTDGQGAVSKWSEPAELLFGAEAPDALGQSFFDGLLTGPLGEDAEQWRRFLAAGDAPHARALVEVTARHAPSGEAFPLEAVFVPVKLDEGFDFSLFLEDLSFELPLNLMLLRMRQQHPVVTRALRAALDVQPQPWDGGRTAGTLVAFRPLGPTPWVEAELARREAERARADAEREEAITNPDPGVQGESVDDLDDAAAVVARLLSALERIDELERVAGDLPGRLEEAKREVRTRAEAAELEARRARAELERLGDAPSAAELLARLETLERATPAERLQRLEDERRQSAAAVEARLTAAVTEASEARRALELRLAELESAAATDERLRAEQAGAAQAGTAELRAALERAEREQHAARADLAAALERIEALQRDTEHLRERVGEAAAGERALADDDRRRLEQLQRDSETARTGLDELRAEGHEARAAVDALLAGSAEALQALRAELGSAAATADARANDELRSLQARLESVEAAGAHAPVDLAPLHARLAALEAEESTAREQLAALRERLGAAADGAELASLGTQLAELRRAFEALRDGGVARADLDAIREQLATVADGGAAKSDLDAVRAALTALGDRVPTRDEVHALHERLDGLAPAGAVDQLRGRVDELDVVHRRLDGLAERDELDALRERLESAAPVGALDELRGRVDGLDALRGRIDELERSGDADEIARLGADAEALRSAIHGLEQRLDAAREESRAHDDAARAAAHDAIERIAEVDRRAEQADAGASGLRAELEALRAETAAAREEAAAARAEAAAARAEAAALRDQEPDPPQTSGGEHMNAVFKEILGLAAKGRPTTAHKPARTPAQTPREPRHGFDDDSTPLAVIGTDGRFKQLNPSFCRLVGYQEHEFAKAAWPSPHDRQLYAQQLQQLAELVSGTLESVPVRSTYMHGQGLMIPVVGEITAMKGEDGLTSHLLLRAEERERAL